MNEIIKLCKGYKRLTPLDSLGGLLNPFYHMEKSNFLLCATPWKMSHEKQSSTAILAIHGYQGYPGEMSYLGLKLFDAGFDVFCPRLPGHGVTQADFLKTNYEDWLGVARSTMGYLKKEYDNVFVLGHSMGGLIATIIAKEFQIERLALIAPSFKIKGFYRLKLHIIKFFKDEIATPWKSDPSFWGICERDENDDETLGQTYWSKLVPKQLLELGNLIDMGIAALPRVYAKTICVLGSKDDALNNDSIEILLKSKIYSEIEVLKLNGVSHLCHYFNVKEKRDLCNDSIVKFFID